MANSQNNGQNTNFLDTCLSHTNDVGHMGGQYLAGYEAMKEVAADHKELVLQFDMAASLATAVPESAIVTAPLLAAETMHHGEEIAQHYAAHANDYSHNIANNYEIGCYVVDEAGQRLHNIEEKLHDVKNEVGDKLYTVVNDVDHAVHHVNEEYVQPLFDIMSDIIPVIIDETPDNSHTDFMSDHNNNDYGSDFGGSNSMGYDAGNSHNDIGSSDNSNSGDNSGSSE